MIIPVRCFSCGSVTGSKWEKYLELKSQGLTNKEALDFLKINRYCCRRMILTHINIEYRSNFFKADYKSSGNLN